MQYHDSRSSAGTTSSRRNSASHDGLEPGRVAVQHRGAWEVATETDDVTVEITRAAGMPPTRESSRSSATGSGSATGRSTSCCAAGKFSRKTPFTEVSEQVLVANVDVAFLVMGLDERDFSIRRLERYLTTAWEGGASPVIVLNKADLATDLDSAVAETESVAFGVPVHVATAVAAEGVDVLLPTSPGPRPACCSVLRAWASRR